MDPVTQAISKCLQWQVLDVQDEINSGSCLDETNADLTLSRISRRMGQKDGLQAAGKFQELLTHYIMVESKDV